MIMCGICGVIDYKSIRNVAVVEEMLSQIKHRGPDDNGIEFLVVNNGDVILGHVRLSVIDLSQAGHQPMSYGGRYYIVFPMV